MLEAGIVGMGLERTRLPVTLGNLGEIHGAVGDHRIGHVGEVDEVRVLHSLHEQPRSADEPDVAFAGRERGLEGREALDTLELPSGDDDVPAPDERLLRERLPREAAHDDGRAERQPLEALQVLGVVPGHPAVDADDAFGRDGGDDAARSDRDLERDRGMRDRSPRAGSARAPSRCPRRGAVRCRRASEARARW